MIYPPRPTNAIIAPLIPVFEKRGFWAQIKWNGTCTVVSVSPDGDIVFKTRHGEDHKAWTPKPEMVEYFRNFPDSIFVGELLHNKGPSIKDTLYLFDVLRYQGTDLVGTTFEERQTKIMQSEVRKIKPLHATVWVADNYVDEGLYGLWNNLSSGGTPLIEGLVLKNPNGVLEPYYKASANAGWQVKCRFPHKNYGF